MLDYLAQWAGSLFDPTGYFPERFQEDTALALRQARMDASVGDWLALLTLAPPLVGTFSALIAAMQSVDIGVSVLIGPAAAVPSAYLIYRKPFANARRRALRLEAELPAALRALSVELNARTQFESALGHLAGSYGELGRELRAALHEIEAGAGVPEAFLAMGERVASLHLKRAAVQMTLSYESGGASEGLRKLAEELEATQKASLREYNARLGMMGLVFIVSSCIAPALFAAFVVVGSSFMDLAITPLQVYLAFLLLFPAVNCAILSSALQVRPSYM